jgi:hypothetical protein
LENETAFYKAIVETEQLMFDHKHDLSRGAIEESDEEKHDFNMMKYMQRQLLENLEKKFGIVYADKMESRDCEAVLPEGKRDFDEWYQSMEAESKKEKFELTICSACYFCNSLREKSEYVPCTLFGCCIPSLRYPWKCLMMDEQLCSFNRHFFFAMLYEAGRDDVVEKFKQKEQELKQICATEMVEVGKQAILEQDLMEMDLLKRNIQFLLKNKFFREADDLIRFVRENSPVTFLGFREMLHKYKI